MTGLLRRPARVGGSPVPPTELGRVVAITGASSGIGRSTAALFARHGWQVGLIARGPPGLQAIHDELAASGFGSAIGVADVSDPVALEAAACLIESALGPIAVWVNCAGNGVYGDFMDVTDAEFRRVTEVTYLGTVFGTRVALRRMLPRGEGVVVNVCSAIAYRGMPWLSSYSGAKHAVSGFTDSVRAELVQNGSKVRIATVFPPAVNTPFFSHAITHMDQSPRPAKPVYQPALVADGILLAVTASRQRVQIGGITVLFAWATRLVPGLIDRAIRQLGKAGQMTGCPEAARLRDPTMWAPSLVASGAHGPFGGESRSFSLQMWANRHRRALLAGAGALVAVLAAWLART